MNYIARVASQDYPIEGKDVVEAVGNNIMALARKAGLGNTAGVTLDKVLLNWRDGILGGKGGIEVEITAHGSDLLVNYDPTEDKPKTATVWVNAKREDSSEELPYEYELVEEKKPDSPFDEPKSLAQTYGYYCAICDEIAANHARVPVKKNILGGICANVEQRFPTMKIANPYKYIELVQQAVTKSFPKNDAKTKKLVERANELALALMDADKSELIKIARDGSGFFHMVHAARWFEAQNKITALAFYRNKAGLTGKQLADIVGISDRQIRKYESADSTLGSANHVVVEKIAKALNVAPKDLVEDGIVNTFDAES